SSDVCSSDLGNTYILMRHGEAESNLTFSINSDPTKSSPLTEKGMKQIEEAGESLKARGIDLIVYSQFERTRESAKIVAKCLGLSDDALIEDARLNELNAGKDLEGKHWDEYENLFSSTEESWNKRIEGVENRRDVYRRAGALLYELEREHQGKTILLLGHISTLNAL